MPIIPWRPFDDLDRFFEDDWFLPSFPALGTLRPAIDVYETKDSVIAEVDIPAGIDPEKVDISVKDQFLTVSGKTEEEKEEKDKGYWRKEIRKGSFQRMVKLPVPVKEDKADAVYEKGVLKITIPKAEKKEEKKIKIKIKKK